MTQSLAFDDLVQLISDREGPARLVVAIAGAPGSGKSTQAERLVAALNVARPGTAALLPMDGYHYDDGLLIARGLRARKGAPETFDVGGLLHMLERLKRNDEDEIAVPVFDRHLEISRGSARLILRAARTLVVEGNYLLLDQAPWSRLNAFFDITVAIDVPEEVLRQRLVARWQGYGLGPDEIEAKVDGNDLPNGRFVRANSRPADVVIAGDARDDCTH